MAVAIFKYCQTTLRLLVMPSPCTRRKFFSIQSPTRTRFSGGYGVAAHARRSGQRCAEIFFRCLSRRSLRALVVTSRPAPTESKEDSRMCYYHFPLSRLPLTRLKNPSFLPLRARRRGRRQEISQRTCRPIISPRFAGRGG